ncbi:hypothetical protein [Paenibacillus beijingensis]|uniref:PepSY domain-containing protein n=1 Tax=Paenibacillus beijingensis TaxID=1126833 RepID=A0A0D5NPY6_9BACL|nr:hypothetical protein [Paenibacillus beijingensis]AJY77374.1 hypothetical protein VN24_25970 [Paenibacillus beijingensis]
MNNILRKRLKHIYIAAHLLLAAAGLIAVHPAAAGLNSHSSKPSLPSQVRQWMDELARQPGLSGWGSADFSIEALGPGTHGWFVHIAAGGGKPAGYIIVNAAEDGSYRLGEYGEGSWPAEQ